MRTAEDVKAKLFKGARVPELFSVVEYMPVGNNENSNNNGVFLFDDKTIGIFMILNPTTGADTITASALTNFFKEKYPENTMLQWSLVSLPDMENILWGYDDIRGDRVSPMPDSGDRGGLSESEYKGRIKKEAEEDKAKIEAMANANRDFVRKGALTDINQNGYRYRNYECWVTVRIKYKGAVPSDKLVEGFMKQIKRSMSTLSPFSPRLGNDLDLERRMNVLLNMYGDKASWKKGPQFKDRMGNGEEVRDNFVDSGYMIEQLPHGVQIYDANAKPCQFIKSMSVRDYPDEMAYGGMINLVGQWLSGAVVLNEHYILTLNVAYPSEAKAKKRFNMKRGIVNNQAKGEILQWLEKLRYQRNDYATVAREMDQEGSKLIEYSVQMSAFCKNEQDAEDFYQTVSGFYEKSNFKLVSDSYFTLPFVLAVLPFGLDETFKRMSNRFSYATTKALRFITPHIAGWKGNTSHPVMIMGDRFGQAVSLDFFESPTNFNIYCAATSGSGKSFLVSTLVNAILGSGVERNSKHQTSGSPRYYDGGQVFMVDVGESYKKLAGMYNNSQFLEFGSESKYSLNPFPSITDMKDVDQMPMIMSLLKTMASPEGKITDDQNAQLMKIVMLTWEAKGLDSTVTDISLACKASEFDFMKAIGRQLEPFCEGGPYADFFNNKYPPVSFDTRLVVCELEQIKSNKHLQITVLMSLVMGIQRKMYISSKEDPRRRMFILDEAWEFIKDEKENPMMKFFAEFIEAGWRRFRKYGASGCLATQSVNDASGSQVGLAVLANSQWKLLLGQQNTEVEALRKNNTIGGANIIRQLETVHTKPPNPKITDEAYSEVLIVSNDVTHVCRLYTPRDIQLINTTKKEEKDLIKAYMDKGMTIGEAIKQIVEKEEKEKAY